MKAKTNRIISLAAAGIVVVGALAAGTIAANANADNLDLILGRGAEHKTESTLDGNYIDFKTSTVADAKKNAQEVTRKTAEEGITLLKNDNLLPLAKTTKITALGYYAWHNNMSGGEDPNSTNGAVSLAGGLRKVFGANYNDAVDFVYHPECEYNSDGKIVKGGQANSGVGDDFADPTSAFATVEGTFAEYSTAVIVLKRNSGEGNDQVRNAGASENGRSGLVIKNAELKLIDYASKHFENVIIVINSANAMELGWLQERDLNNGKYRDPYTNTEYDFSKVKAALWAGCCGSQGGLALANILNGDVNPSGHLVDTYVRDLRNDPTWCNFGSFVYEDSDELNSYQDETFFVHYEEGIYVGYRYYETAAYEAMQGNYDGFDYDQQVVFPFGYGLSYTTFDQEYDGDPTYDINKAEWTFKVKVTNTGQKAGKSVAQIYVNAPYDKNSGKEKAHVLLAGFGKTEILEPGKSETLEIKVNRDYFTSYDYKNDKCWYLDAGDYKFYLSENAHGWAKIDAEEAAAQAKHLKTVKIDKNFTFKDGKDGKRLTDLSTAVNKEDDELNFMFKEYTEAEPGDGFCINFTRTNFKASFPTAPQDDDLYFPKDERAREQVATYNVWAEKNNPITEMPVTDRHETSYVLADMRGVDWDDEKWDHYMNQFTVDSMSYMFMNGGWNEKADSANGVPESYDADSPYGFYAGQLKFVDVNKWYCGDPMLAATYNVKLAREVGEAFGEEAWNNRQGGTLITGVYGYGLNMHRSAFGGRNYEYYAEDGVLAGKMAAAESGGASEKGLITFMKHFCLNDQETNRQLNGYCAWVNEQAFREVYLRGWELYIKEAEMTVKYYNDGTLASKKMPAATGIMTCYNRIGATYGGASLSLNGILRDEFGYHGTSITDAGGQPNTYMTTDFLLRRGGHLTLTNNGTNGLYDTTSPTAVYYLKDAAKHILYNKANSNCVMGLAPGAKVWYDISPWRLGIYAAWGVVGALAVVDLVFIVLIGIGKVKVKEKEWAADEEWY